MAYTDRVKFSYYAFEKTLPLEVGVSSFDVEIVDGGNRMVHTNAGRGFPLDDRLVLLPALSCRSFGAADETGVDMAFNATVAVRAPDPG